MSEQLLTTLAVLALVVAVVAAGVYLLAPQLVQLLHQLTGGLT